MLAAEAEEEEVEPEPQKPDEPIPPPPLLLHTVAIEADSRSKVLQADAPLVAVLPLLLVVLPPLHHCSCTAPSARWLNSCVDRAGWTG